MQNTLKLQAPFERLKSQHEDSPEIALNKSIILQAITDYCLLQKSKSKKDIQKNAKNWMFHDPAKECEKFRVSLADVKKGIEIFKSIKAISLFVFKIMLKNVNIPKNLKEKQNRKKAEEWVYNNFVEVCINVDLEPECVRKIAKQTREEIQHRKKNKRRNK